MKARIFPACIALALLGCATERPTRGQSDGGFPTLSLSDNIVIDDLGIFDSLAYVDSINGEFGVQLPVAEFGNAEELLELQLVYDGPRQCHRAQVFVFDNFNRTWIGAENQRGGVCIGWPTPDHNVISLLPHAQGLKGPFVDSMGVLRLKGDLSNPSVRVLEVHPNYHPLRVSLTAYVAEALWIGEELLVWTKQRGLTEWTVDSLIVFDRDGVRRTGMELHIEGVSENGIDGIAWSGHELWVAADRRYIVLDATMQPTGEFYHPQNPPNQLLKSLYAIAWIDGRIWIREERMDREYDPNEVPRGTPYLTVVDPWASVDSGYSVIERSFAIDESLAGMGEVCYDGKFVNALALHGLVRMNLDGDILDTLPLPVWPTSVTWDGEAFWMTHGGPWDYITEHRMISRFYPR